MSVNNAGLDSVKEGMLGTYSFVCPPKHFIKNALNLHPHSDGLKGSF
jgi:hypothetical protein